MKPGFFTFVTLKYVHDAMSGEAVNVGLLAFWPSSVGLKFKLRTSMGRVKHLFPDVDRRAFLLGLRLLKRGLTSLAMLTSAEPLLADQTDALALARRVLPPDDSSFQWSPMGRGFAEDAEGEFLRLYERLVAKYDGDPRPNRSDDAIWRPVREMLGERRVPIEFEERTFRGETDEVTFDNTWKNGAWHAYQPVSLDLSTPENILDKARRWRGQMAGVADRSQDKDGVQVNFILGRPQDTALMKAYDQAVAIFSRMPMHPRIYLEEQTTELVDEIEREFRTHQEEVPSP